jgi:hypothetical protein
MKNFFEEIKPMRTGKPIEITLGDLIIAVTDEVTHWIPDQAAAYFIVSCILSDLLVHSRTRLKRRRPVNLH